MENDYLKERFLFLRKLTDIKKSFKDFIFNLTTNGNEIINNKNQAEDLLT